MDEMLVQTSMRCKCYHKFFLLTDDMKQDITLLHSGILEMHLFSNKQKVTFYFSGNSVVGFQFNQCI